MHEPLKLSDALLNAGMRAGFRATQFGEAQGYPLFALSRPSAGANGEAKRVYLSGGIHGDEPATIHALLDLLEADAFDREHDFLICPLINPTGIARGRRENADGLDLNRDFRALASAEIRALTRFLDTQPPFDLSICLHEDWESRGFYLYCLGGEPSERIARAVIEEVRAIGPIDGSPQIDGFDADDGLIAPGRESIADAIAEWPEAFYLYLRKPHRNFTFESPSSLPLPQRAQILSHAVQACVAAWSRR